MKMWLSKAADKYSLNSDTQSKYFRLQLIHKIIRNEYIRGTAKIAKLGEKIRGARLRWYGHVKRREAGYVGRRTLEMECREEGKGEGRGRGGWMWCGRIWRVWVLWRRMWLTEGCGGRRRAVATPNRESRKEKKERKKERKLIHIVVTIPLYIKADFK